MHRVVQVSSTQPVYSALCKDQTAASVTTENPREEFLINQSLYGVIVSGSHLQVWDSQMILFDVICSVLSTLLLLRARDLSRVYNWQFNIYPNEKPDCSFLLRRLYTEAAGGGRMTINRSVNTEK